MVKKYYSDYVRHALRFYARNQNPSALNMSLATQEDWSACNIVLGTLLPASIEILFAVYQPLDTMADNVYKAAKKFNVPQDNIWSLMADVEKLIAQERGLL